MFDGISKRIVSVWFPRFASDRALRLRAATASHDPNRPFILYLSEANTDRLSCLNLAAERAGLSRGMTLADARAYCPDLLCQPGEPRADARFLTALRRWATRYCPWVGYEGRDGLVLDITGAAHLWGGEAEMLAELEARLTRAGLSPRLGLSDTRGGSWALARYGTQSLAPMKAGLTPFASLPVAALRLEDKTCVSLQRLGLRTIADLAKTPRGPVTRRFGPEVLLRLDQLRGEVPEGISPEADPPHFATRMTLPEPIGLTKDVMAGLERLLRPLCDKLERHGQGARQFSLHLRRVDQASQEVSLRLAAPMTDALRILPLFARGVEAVEAGFGIDQLRLVAEVIEPLPPRQMTHSQLAAGGTGGGAALEDLITKIGTRIGIENIQRFLPAQSHIPARSFTIAPAAFSRAEGGWPVHRPRPPQLFRPEHVKCLPDAAPPRRFHWRNMSLTLGRAVGPERIAPEWWLEDENWRHGLRDYWRIETREGRRLWMFFTPQQPSWYVEGEFA